MTALFLDRTLYRRHRIVDNNIRVFIYTINNYYILYEYVSRYLLIIILVYVYIIY